MAVPGSGAITMLGVAQERKYGTYGFGTISYPITMFELLNGGGPNSFPALNGCPQTNVPSYSMNGWYGYNQTATCSSCVQVNIGYDIADSAAACIGETYIYYSSANNPIAPWFEGVPFYSNTTCTGFVSSGWYSNGSDVAFWNAKTQTWTIIELCTFGPEF